MGPEDLSARCPPPECLRGAMPERANQIQIRAPGYADTRVSVRGQMRRGPGLSV